MVGQWVYKDYIANSENQLQLQNNTKPRLGSPTDVLVRIRAVSLNYRDIMIKTGTYIARPKGGDLIPCSDAAGEVEEVGERVTTFKKGDRVCPIFNQGHLYGDMTEEARQTGLGGQIDGVLTEEISLVKIPDFLSFEEASTLPCAGVTVSPISSSDFSKQAWNALYSLKPLLPGQTVVVQGTGGVSIFALQIAHAAGATVIATSSSDTKLQTAKSLGADHLINYSTTPSWSVPVREITNGRGADHVIDVGGASTIAESFKAIKFGGVIDQIGMLPAKGDVEKVDASVRAIQTQGILRGILVGGKDVFEDLIRGLEKGRWTPIIDKVFGFEEAKEAFEYLKSQKHIGKVVIRVS